MTAIFRKSILIVAAVLLSLHGFSQIEEFSRDQQKYIEELMEFLEDEDRGKGKDLGEDKFTPYWNNQSAFTEAEREQIYTISNGMLDKRMDAFPDFEMFLESLMVFASPQQEEESFHTWLNVLEELSKGRVKRDLTEFIELSHGLATENTFYESRSTKWQSTSANYRFELRDDEPVVIFPELDLKCTARGDSIMIYATTGTYFPETEEFRGNQGKVTWERAGLDPNKTFAIIQNDYKVNARSSDLDVDSVLFYNEFFEYPLKGELSDKTTHGVTQESADYPRFESYDKRLRIENIVDKVDYEGGFIMEGASLQGFGSYEQPANITFKVEGAPFLRASAQDFMINPKQINSADARIAIYLENDSIVHPELDFKFQRNERKLTLIRSDKGISRSPYYDSYHDLDLYFEALYWNIDDPVMEMGRLFGSSQTRAAFESSNFFKEDRYDRLQGMDRMHPLVAIRSYARSVNSNEFEAEGLAHHMRYRLTQIIPMLIDLTTKGFIHFDPDQKIVRVKPRLNDYIKARSEKVDYDVIVFNSNVEEGMNATLNISNKDLLLRGINKIILSDSQRVAIFPEQQKVTVRKNRNFTFGGEVFAGNFQFFGEDYEFNYDKFKIDLNKVDSARLYVEQFEEVGPGERKRKVKLKNVIEGIKGTLEIDNPFNKSGIQDEFTEYPILTCEKNSFVFYDDSEIQEGVYNRNRFFFELEPFVIDSLDNFDAEDVAFNGTLNSGGIFPDMKEELRVQKDYSLGFRRATPDSGLPLYGGKAKFTDDIVLNYKGLQGDGVMDYLSATAESDNFTFYPDSTNGETSSFTNKEGAGPPPVPEANAGVADLQFLPVPGELQVDVINSPINMFNEQATVDSGGVVLTESGMNGNGLMRFAEAEMRSKKYEYNRLSFDADTANFNLASMTENNMAFKTDNVKAHIDFDKRQGDFESNGDETSVDFPVNQYICYMDKFKWFMDKNDIALESSREVVSDFVIDTELDLSKSNFVSTNPDQDSLNFMAPKAVYDLDDHVLTCDGIPWIRVADAKITPDSGRVVIRKKADMDPLDNATILANYVTQYHEIYDASVNIKARRNYTATGKYNYVDKNDSPQTIPMGSIAVDTSYQTYATGNIGEASDFMLSPHFDFAGEVKLLANQKFLNFNGRTRITHDCESFERNWMNFKTEIDPKEVMIPVDTVLTDDKGNAIESGIILAQEPYSFYGAFLSQKHRDNDEPLVTSRGYLAFDENSQKYEVASRDRLREQNSAGNYNSLDKGSCVINSEGKLDLASKTGQVKIKNFGSAAYNGAEGKLEVRGSMVMDFFFNENSLERMQTLISQASDLKPVDITKTDYERSIRRILNQEDADELISELSLTGQIKKLPDAMEQSLYIADVRFEWDSGNESLVSKGDIGIASIEDGQVFRYVPGRIEIEKRSAGDEIHIYLKADEENWFYFNYNRGLMQAYSSDEDFNNPILDMKEDKRKSPGGKDEEDYSYMLGSRSKANMFRDR